MIPKKALLVAAVVAGRKLLHRRWWRWWWWCPRICHSLHQRFYIHTSAQLTN